MVKVKTDSEFCNALSRSRQTELHLSIEDLVSLSEDGQFRSKTRSVCVTIAGKGVLMVACHLHKKFPNVCSWTFCHPGEGESVCFLKTQNIPFLTLKKGSRVTFCSGGANAVSSLRMEPESAVTCITSTSLEVKRASIHGGLLSLKNEARAKFLAARMHGATVVSAYGTSLSLQGGKVDVVGCRFEVDELSLLAVVASFVNCELKASALVSEGYNVFCHGCRVEFAELSVKRGRWTVFDSVVDREGGALFFERKVLAQS